jgi:hypothetical protein
MDELGIQPWDITWSSNSRNVDALKEAMGDVATRPFDQVPLPSNATHHIVPPLHPAYTDARQQLQRLGISPNAAFNGVELDSRLHAVIHTDAVGRALEDVLRSQNNAAEARLHERAHGPVAAECEFRSTAL